MGIVRDDKLRSKAKPVDRSNGLVDPIIAVIRSPLPYRSDREVLLVRLTAAATRVSTENLHLLCDAAAYWSTEDSPLCDPPMYTAQHDECFDGTIPFPLPDRAVRDGVVDRANHFLRKLATEDILALIPVLVRHAAPEAM